MNTPDCDSTAPPGGQRAVLPRLTARSVNGIPQLGVLPLAQLVLLGAGGRLGRLNLRTSDTGSGPERKQEVSHSEGEGCQTQGCRVAAGRRLYWTGLK